MENFATKNLKILVDKTFSVYVENEFERKTNFLGLMKLLADYSDFFLYSCVDQKVEINKWIKTGQIYIDANILVKFKI